ncbi:hypothetical protein ACQ86G_11220 [Roseateles chitinivorans]|uniref:hypothetical protein n=1 Tax=Roseateles chitinivorans TaxID=2917965 RepID=UPI003D679C0E
MKQQANGRPSGRAWIVLALTVAAGTAHAAATEYGDFLLEADAPYSGTFLKYHNILKAWTMAGKLESLEVPLVETADRSRVLRRVVSAGVPMPENAYKELKRNAEKATPGGPGAWYLYWSRITVQPINGASTARMFSSAERRAVHCETGRILEAGKVVFASLDLTGAPQQPWMDYLRLEPTPARQVAADANLAAEVRAVCGPILAATYGEEESRRRLDTLMAAPEKSEEQRRFEAMRQELLAAARAPSPASSAASSSASTSAAAGGGPIGSAKARVRLFQQNGLGGGLTNEAACASSDSASSAGSGFWKAFGSLAGVAGNTSIGMPETEASRTVGERSQLGSKAYFVEREVTAEAPVTLDFSFDSQGQGKSCNTLTMSFVPEAGADYEARMDVGGLYCRLRVSRILQGGQLLPEPLTPAAAACPKKG